MLYNAAARLVDKSHTPVHSGLACHGGHCALDPKEQHVIDQYPAVEAKAVLHPDKSQSLIIDSKKPLW